MEQKTENEIIEIDLVDLLLALLSKWYMFVVIALIFGGCAFGYSKYYLKPIYQSTSELYVLTKSTSITSIADIQTGTSLTRDYVEIVASRPVLDNVSENLNLGENYEQLKAKITVETPSNSRLILIKVTDEDPHRAKIITDEIAKVASKYISEKMNQDPPSVIQFGYEDEKPIGPNVKNNTLGGCFVGFFLVGIIVMLSFIFNDTVITVEDMEKKVGINVLASLPLEMKSEYDGKAKKRKNRK